MLLAGMLHAGSVIENNACALPEKETVSINKTFYDIVPFHSV